MIAGVRAGIVQHDERLRCATVASRSSSCAPHAGRSTAASPQATAGRGARGQNQRASYGSRVTSAGPAAEARARARRPHRQPAGEPHHRLREWSRRSPRWCDCREAAAAESPSAAERPPQPFSAYFGATRTLPRVARRRPSRDGERCSRQSHWRGADRAATTTYGGKNTTTCGVNGGKTATNPVVSDAEHASGCRRGVRGAAGESGRRCCEVPYPADFHSNDGAHRRQATAQATATAHAPLRQGTAVRAAISASSRASAFGRACIRPGPRSCRSPNGGGESFAVDIRRARDLQIARPEREPHRPWPVLAWSRRTPSETDGEPSGTLYALDAFLVWLPRQRALTGRQMARPRGAELRAARLHRPHALSAESARRFCDSPSPAAARRLSCKGARASTRACGTRLGGCGLRLAAQALTRRRSRARTLAPVRLPPEAAEPMQVLHRRPALSPHRHWRRAVDCRQSVDRLPPQRRIRGRPDQFAPRATTSPGATSTVSERSSTTARPSAASRCSGTAASCSSTISIPTPPTSRGGRGTVAPTSSGARRGQPVVPPVAHQARRRAEARIASGWTRPAP